MSSTFSVLIHGLSGSCVSCSTEVAEGGSQVLSKANCALFTATNLTVIGTCLVFPWLVAVKYNSDWTIVN